MLTIIPAGWLRDLHSDAPFWVAIRACPQCFNRAELAAKLGTDCQLCPEHAGKPCACGESWCFACQKRERAEFEARQPMLFDSSAAPRYGNVSCSQCGADFGPGDFGFSMCSEHDGLVEVEYAA